MSLLKALRARVHERRPAALLLLVAGMGCAGNSGPTIDDHELMARIRGFEAALAGKTDAQKSAELAVIAGRMLHSRVRVRSASVVTVYERGTDWDTRPFFGFDYVEAHYVRLVNLDPEFYRELHGTRCWASVACTFDDRQLMFELAMDPRTHAGLRSGQPVSFTCEVAGIIRGKTVYCRLVTMERSGPGA